MVPNRRGRHVQSRAVHDHGQTQPVWSLHQVDHRGVVVVEDTAQEGPASAPSWPSSSEPLVPRYPLPVVKSVSNVFVRAGSKPSSTTSHCEPSPSKSACTAGVPYARGP